MRIVDIREVTIDLNGAISNAIINFNKHTVSLVALISDQFSEGKPIVGFGFNSIGRFAQGGILRERMLPRLSEVAPEYLLSSDGSGFDAGLIAKIAMKDEKPGGHGDRAGAAAALELAVWDLNAKLLEEPAYKTLRRYFGVAESVESIPVYAAGGYYYPKDSIKRLGDELLNYQDIGYHSFKIKIGGGEIIEDISRIEEAVTIAGCGSKVAVDANGCFDQQQALDMATAIEPFKLRWFEEPGDPLDFDLNRNLIESYSGNVATGENLFSLVDARNLMRFGGMRAGKDIFQMDPGLAYGITEYHSILQTLEEFGHQRKQCYPHGGHLINLHIALGLGLGGCEAYPQVFQPIGGYSAQCSLENGRITPSDAPGFGLEQKQDLYPLLCKLVN
jgi:L-alanine-DL-glutamate epimerase-like enolase superfamily enzyme